MRTTVEMKAEHRSALLAIAARRGQKGFSSVLTEAIDVYLSQEEERRARKKQLRELMGSLPNFEAEQLRRTASELRELWR